MEPSQPEWMSGAVATGTTIMAVTFKDGIIMGADSRTSTGNYVSNRCSDKITALTDNVYICRSGSAADTQLISDYVRYFTHQHVIEKGAPADVKTVANLAMQLAYHNKKMLMAGMIVAGYDARDKGSVFALPIGGTLLKVPFATGGSGSSYITGFLDYAWKEDMTEEEAKTFVLRAVSLAMARDGSSGGVVRLVTITKDGAKKDYFPGDKLPLYHEEMAPQESLLKPNSGEAPMVAG